VRIKSDVTGGGLPQHRYKVRIVPTDENFWDPVSGRQTRVGYTFQLCLEWRGSLKIEKVRVAAQPHTEQIEPYCDEEDAEKLLPETGHLTLDDFTYQIGA
jgi:hypothetical protein